MGYGKEKSGQSDLSGTLKTGLSFRNLKGNKGHQPGLQQEVKEKIRLDLYNFMHFLSLCVNPFCAA